MPRFTCFFFSWGTFSLWVHREVLEDDRSEGCWALGVFFFSPFLFFCFFLSSLAYVSKVLGRKKEDTKVGKKDTYLGNISVFSFL